MQLARLRCLLAVKTLGRGKIVTRSLYLAGICYAATLAAKRAFR